jgi:predicted permease
MKIEHWIYTLPLRLRSLFQREQVEQDLDDELRYHLEHRIQQEMAKGVNSEEARFAALQSMQGLEQRKEECRDQRRVAALETLERDLRYALRMLRKSPAFTAVAVISLALGIGANTAIFSLIDALLLRPLPVPQPDRLVDVFVNTPSGSPPYYFTYPIFEALRARNQVFSRLFTWSDHQFQMQSGSGMVHVPGMLASGDYFEGLRVPPALGRTFTSADDKPEGGIDGPVAVISHEFWSSHFQQNPSAVGSALTLDGVRFTITGVMPRGFFGAEVGTNPQVWVPLTSKVGDQVCLTSRSCWWLVIMGRLKSGISPEQANAQLRTISPRVLQDTLPQAWGSASQKRFLQWRFLTGPGAAGWTFLRIQFSNPLAVLMTLVIVVLLIACANMANLLLARTSVRQREIAVRLAMGAGRTRIIRQLLTESLLLSVIGGFTGILFAYWSAHLLVGFLSASQQHSFEGQAAQLNLSPDWRVVLFTLATSVAAGLLFGLGSALRATRASISHSLKERTHSIRIAAGRVGIGRLVLGAQVGLSILLIAGAGLFAGSLFRLLTMNPGFNPENVSYIQVDTDKLPQRGPALLNIYTHLLHRTASLPGIDQASLMWFPPLSNGGWDDYIDIPGGSRVPREQRDAFMNLAGPNFFDVMQIPLIAGRQFTDADTAASEKVGILNKLAADRLFPGRTPIGEHVVLDKQLIRIVGVAGNTKYLNMREPDPLTLYLPYSQRSGEIPSLTFVIRTRPGVRGAFSEFRAVLREIAPAIPISKAETMEEQLNDSLGSERLMASLSIFFATLALLLTSIGLYGVLAYLVTGRTGEIGIRMALGARAVNVVWLVLRETATQVFIGISAGILAVIFTSKLIASLLYGVQPNDPGNLVLAVVTLLAVSALAAYVPALRATRVDPVRALREE